MARLAVQGIFLLTGVTNTLFQQFISYQGASFKFSFLPVWVNYLGVLLSAVLFSHLLPVTGPKQLAPAPAASAAASTTTSNGKDMSKRGSASASASASAALDKGADLVLGDVDVSVVVAASASAQAASCASAVPPSPHSSSSSSVGSRLAMLNSLDNARVAPELQRQTKVGKVGGTGHQQRGSVVLVVDGDSASEDDVHRPILQSRNTRETSKDSLVEKELKSVLDRTSGEAAVPPHTQEHERRQIIQLSVVDVLANAVAMYALQVAGSGTYQVCYSSILVTTAVLSQIFLRKKHSGMQWLAILAVTMGLVLSAYGANQEGPAPVHDEAVGTESAAYQQVDDERDSAQSLDKAQGPVVGGRGAFGVAITLFATGIYAGVYIMFEKLLSGPAAIDKDRLSHSVGKYGLVIVSVIIVCWTIPNWDAMVTQPMAKVNGSIPVALFWYFLFLISVALHNSAYYSLMSSSGAVTAGIIQAVRAVAVFVSSALLFCDVQPSQCFTPGKGLSSFIVISGVLFYSFATDWAAKSQVGKTV